MDNQDPINQDVLALIKEAHRHPKQLSKEAVLEFISKPINLGRPVRLPKPKRGKQSAKTQYDRHHERFRDYYRRLVLLPKLRIGIKTVPEEAILQIANTIPVERGKPSRIKKELELRGLPSPDVSTILKVLKNRVR